MKTFIARVVVQTALVLGMLFVTHQFWSPMFCECKTRLHFASTEE